MNDINSDPLGTVQISKDLLAAQQKFLPTGEFFKQLSEAAQIVSGAQMAYGQALLRANALLFGALLRPASLAAREVSPSVAAAPAISA